MLLLLHLLVLVIVLVLVYYPSLTLFVLNLLDLLLLFDLVVVENMK